MDGCIHGWMDKDIIPIWLTLDCKAGSKIIEINRNSQIDTVF